MSVHLFDGALAGLPAEAPLLAAVTLRLIQDSERERFDEELRIKHYLKNATAVGRVLRYVAEYRGQWVALVVFCQRRRERDAKLTDRNGTVDICLGVPKRPEDFSTGLRFRSLWWCVAVRARRFDPSSGNSCPRW